MISFRLPDDEEMTLPVAHTEIEKNSATCTVVKDAGDDPDVTHGASIVVTVSLAITRTSVSCKVKEWDESPFRGWDWKSGNPPSIASPGK